jgi:hypothetical protein
MPAIPPGDFDKSQMTQIYFPLRLQDALLCQPGANTDRLAHDCLVNEELFGRCDTEALGFRDARGRCREGGARQ